MHSILKAWFFLQFPHLCSHGIFSALKSHVIMAISEIPKFIRPRFTQALENRKYCNLFILMDLSLAFLVLT